MREPKGVVGHSGFAGRTFVLTGTLGSFTRAEAEGHIRKGGGEVAASVSRKTYAVIAGEGPGSKLEEAKKLGVAVWTEEDLKNILNESK